MHASAFRLVRALASVSCFVALVAYDDAFAQAKRAMTVDDVIDLVQVSSPRIAPDGRRVLYTLSELGKWKDNKRVTSIWIADADGGNAHRFLANEKDRAAARALHCSRLVIPSPPSIVRRCRKESNHAIPLDHCDCALDYPLGPSLHAAAESRVSPASPR